MAGDSPPPLTPTPPITPGEGAKQGRLSFILRAFQSRNYRLFFTGQLLSLIGTWLTTMATSWLVNRITDDPRESPRMLGYVNFAALMPAFLLSPFAGVLVDRWRKHRLLIWTQTLSMLQSFGLAMLVFLLAGYNVKPTPHTVIVIIWWLIGLSMFQGFVNAFDIPGRQSFVIRLVERREDLPNAIALNSSMFNSARLIGPAIAGILIWKVGEAWCFTIDGFSYLAVIIALLMMRVDEGERPAQHRHILVEMKEGIRYATGFTPILALVMLLASGSFVSTPVTILMPRFATEVLHGDARTQGSPTSSIAAGALAGALRLAARKSVLGLGGQLPWMTAGLGISMILFSFSATLWLSMLALVGVGFCTMTQMATCNTLLQTLVEDRMRGRVMSLFTMAFMGMVPLGSLASGQLAAGIGPAKTVAAGGVLCIFVGLAFATRVPKLRAMVRPIFVQRGILPETAGAIAAADAAVKEPGTH